MCARSAMSAHDRWLSPLDIEAQRPTSPPGWLLAGSTTLLILLVGAAVTASFLRSSEDAALTLTQRTLDERAIRLQQSIVDRLAACEGILHAGAGFIDIAWPITREHWHGFVRPLLGSHASTGVQGFGFTGVVDKLEPWQVEMSRDISRDNLQVDEWPGQTTVLYLEPMDARNRRAIGFDMTSEPVRRAAMHRARDSGSAALSGTVRLFQEIDSAAQPGFLLYVPVYERDFADGTVEKRRESLIGYVFSPFRSFDFLDSAFHGEAQDVRIEVYDGRELLPAAELYRRGAAPIESIYVSRHIAIGGHEWTMRVSATPALLQANQRIPSQLFSSVGSAVTLLVAGLVFAMARSRQMLRDRLAADKRLFEQERDAATMLENSLEAFIVINERDEILEWNKQSSLIFGWSREDVLGQLLGQLIVPERMRQAHVEAVSNFHFRERSVLGKRVEMPAVRRDGDEICVAISIASVIRRGETVFFASLRDVTARRLQEAQVRQLNATLEQRVAERTQALECAHRQLEAAYRDLEAFTRSVSHDLRAPLRAINGYAALLSRDLGSELTPQAQRDVDAIAQTTQRMSTIIDDLLKLASVTQRELRPEELPLGDLVQQVVTELDPAAEMNMHIAHEQLGHVRADPGLLSLALRNLISNAIKFSRKREQPEIWVGASEDSGERICFVRDNGAGFDPKYADRLFSAFQRLHSEREFEGTGLGLTIVKSAIEKNGGRVWAESTPGCGATFYFVLPNS